MQNSAAIFASVGLSDLRSNSYARPVPVITKLEPDLFKTVMALSVEDFNFLVWCEALGGSMLVPVRAEPINLPQIWFDVKARAVQVRILRVCTQRRSDVYSDSGGIHGN